MNPTAFGLLATILFTLAVLHTFMIKAFHHLATLSRPGSVRANLFHMLGEIEIVFGIWAGFLVRDADSFCRAASPDGGQSLAIGLLIFFSYAAASIFARTRMPDVLPLTLLPFIDRGMLEGCQQPSQAA